MEKDEKIQQIRERTKNATEGNALKFWSDCNFILSNDVPYLFDALEQAQAEIERLNGEIEDLKIALCDPLAQHE